MSYACTKHKIVICDCYGNKVMDLESRLAGREKEIEALKIEGILMRRDYKVMVEKADSYREALEKIKSGIAVNNLVKLDREGMMSVAKAALGELERRDEGEGA